MIFVERKNFRIRTPYITTILILIMLILHGFNEDYLLEYSKGSFTLSLLLSSLGNTNFLILVSNIIYLYMFGDNVEDVIGHFGYLIIFLILGFFSTFIYLILHLGENFKLLGTSGAVSGIMGIYLVFFPKVKTSLLFFTHDRKRIYQTSLNNFSYTWSISIWFILQFAQMIIELKFGSVIAFSSNIFTFLIGIFFGFAFKKLGFIDRHLDKIRNLTNNKKSIVCPSCSFPMIVNNYGRQKCRHCDCEFYFDSKGKNILIY